MAQSFERGPTEQAGKVYQMLADQVDALIAKERQLESSDIQAFNAMLRELDVPAVPVKLDKPIS
jgi:S-adenosylmethionine synthetase